MKSTLRSFIAVFMLASLSSCALLNASKTAILLPEARQQLENYLPADVRADLNAEFTLVDQTLSSFNALVEGDVDITFVSAAEKVFGSVEKAKRLEVATADIEQAVVDYSIASSTEVPPLVVETWRDTKATYKLIRDNPNTVKLAQFVSDVGPLALYVIKKKALSIGTGGIL